MCDMAGLNYATFRLRMISLLFSIALALTSSNGATVPPQVPQDRAVASRERLPGSCACALKSPSNESDGSDKVKINYSIFVTGLPTLATYVQRVKVFCKTGYFLAVEDEKKVVGTTNMSSDDKILFEWQSMDTNIVRLKHVGTGRYLAITQKGRLTAQLKVTADSLFTARREENDFHSFASYKYFTAHRNNLFLGIKQNGRCKAPKQTFPGQTAVQFLLLDEHFNRTNGKRRPLSFLTDDTSGRRSTDD